MCRLPRPEAALVASYNRGARLITASGGCNARVVAEAVSRTPMFAFESIIEAEQFVAFIRSHRDVFNVLVDKTTAHGKLVGAETLIEGNHVYLDLRYTTGDASGQNMVTFASNAILQNILQNSPVTPDTGSSKRISPVTKRHPPGAWAMFVANVLLLTSLCLTKLSSSNCIRQRNAWSTTGMPALSAE